MKTAFKSLKLFLRVARTNVQTNRQNKTNVFYSITLINAPNISLILYYMSYYIFDVHTAANYNFILFIDY